MIPYAETSLTQEQRDRALQALSGGASSSGSATGNLFSSIPWMNLLQGGANLGLIEKGISDVRAAGQAQQQGINALTNQIRSDMQFKPYTVTSATGSFATGPEGATSTLSPEMQQAMNKLQEGAGMFYNRTLMDTGARANEITQQMEAALAPQRERDRLALEERLLSQGRLGVSTAQYGGSPEQFALAKAVEEQRAMNALNARQQAMGEQLQNYNIGQSMFGLSFLPQQQNLAASQFGVPFAELLNRANLQRGITTGELGTAGIAAQTQSDQMANMLRLAQLQSLSDMFLGSQSSGAGLLGSLLSGGGTNAQSNASWLDNFFRTGNFGGQP